MDDEFIELAREQLAALEKQQQALRTKIMALEAQISSLSTFISAATDEINLPPFMVRSTPPPPRENEQKTRRRTGPRGRKLKAILAVLREAFPQGLGFDEITFRAASKGVELVRPSLRSQLSKAKGDGYVENRGGTYFYVPGPLEPDVSQELFSQTQGIPGAPVKRTDPENGGTEPSSH